MKLIPVVCMARNRVIGRNGDMPWRMPSDFKHFRATTLGKPVVMGRKTFDAIGKALDGRLNYVVTRQPGLTLPGVVIAASLEEVIAAERGKGTPELMVLGGGELYALALPLADRIVATILAVDLEGDTRFPELDAAIWAEVSRVPLATGPKDDYAAEIVIYERRR